MTTAEKLPAYTFDDRNIRWRELPGFDHFVYTIFDIDVERKVVDLALKFEPNERIFLHRHTALTNTLVIEGEHRLYEPTGELKEIRPVGSYTSSPAGGEAHREGGGRSGGIVFYSVRGGEDDTMFEVLDDDLAVIGTLGFTDFAALFAEQRAA